MAATPGFNLNVAQDGSYGLTQSDCIYARVLGTPGTAESVTPPAKAKRVVFSADGDFYARMDGTAAAVPAADVSDGSAPELNPGVRNISYDNSNNPVAISLVSSAARIVTLMFYQA